jgi:hypothetical protein
MPAKMGAAKLVPPATVRLPAELVSRKPLVQLLTWPEEKDEVSLVQ